MSETGAAYDDLMKRVRRVSYLEDAAGLLGWDQRTMMPEGGTPARSKQLSALSAASHEHLTDPETGELLDAVGGDALDDEQRAVVREVRHDHDRAVRVPDDLVERISETQSDNQEIWGRAKAEDDFDAFAPAMQRLRDLQVERATHIDPDRSPYEVLWEDSERYLPLSTVERVFDTLREELVPLIEDIRENGRTLPAPFAGETFSDEQERAASEAVLDLLGYEREHGRLDVAPHPFMSGTQYDARITTRWNESDPLDPLTATIHEFGHATYQLGLRKDEYGTPLGQPRSSGVHESQSRFWENHVGRTRAFWELFAPTFNEQLGTDHDAETLYQAANRIYPENCIRVEADELTYHFHIILRSEIDRAFVEGDLPVEEIPRVWNEKMDEYLGVTPDTDSEGCLQDIHWSYYFAGFQNYTIGSVLAAQLDATLREELDVDGLVREGEFDPIREWMEEHVHRHGCRYPTDELIEVATGEPLTAEYFVDYATEKFGELYGL